MFSALLLLLAVIVGSLNGWIGIGSGFGLSMLAMWCAVSERK